MMIITEFNMQAPHNNLHDSINKNLKLYDRVVWPTNMTATIRSSIDEVITKLNAQFKRCKPFKPKWDEAKRDGKPTGEWSMFLSDVNEYRAAFTISLVKDISDI